MAIDLTDPVQGYADLACHIGHHIQCVAYGDEPVAVALECVDCALVLVDFDKPDLLLQIGRARDALWGTPENERRLSPEQAAYVEALEALYYDQRDKRPKF